MAIVEEVPGMSVVLSANQSGGWGRPPVTSRIELEQICLAMFAADGFAETSVEDIATAAGIGRRTFFRYFQSKNDVVWGDFDGQLDRFRQWFSNCPAQVPVRVAIRSGVVAFNTFDAESTAALKIRMRIILSSPALQAYSTLRYQAWRSVIVDFVASRLVMQAGDLLPRTLGFLALGAALAAYEQWLITEEGDLIGLLERALAVLLGPGSAEGAS